MNKWHNARERSLSCGCKSYQSRRELLEYVQKNIIGKIANERLKKELVIKNKKEDYKREKIKYGHVLDHVMETLESQKKIEKDWINEIEQIRRNVESKLIHIYEDNFKIQSEIEKFERK